MASTGNIRVNGGYIDADNMASGRFSYLVVSAPVVTGGGVGFEGRKAKLPEGYKIANGAYSADAIIAEGKPIPGSAAEIAYNVISKRATVIALNVDQDGFLHAIVENNVEGWYVNSPNDNMDREHPGIVPKPENPVPDPALAPILSAEFHKLGTVDLPDGTLAEGTAQYDFSGVAVAFDNSLRLDYTNMEIDDGGIVTP